MGGYSQILFPPGLSSPACLVNGLDAVMESPSALRHSRYVFQVQFSTILLSQARGRKQNVPDLPPIKPFGPISSLFFVLEPTSNHFPILHLVRLELANEAVKDLLFLVAL